ncbi:MAG: hypothetical protein HYY63_05415, partial [Elusimicrobia bacterium]|nr:hypothetical protein [Elusimicrobiota bacterium]
MNLSQLKNKPPFSLLTWLYRLIQLPSRFHQLNDQFWNLVGKVQSLETASEERQKRLENLESQLSMIRRDLEMIHYALKQKAGILDEVTVKAIAGNELVSETYPYFAFENQFRGSSEEIKKIQSQYLEFIQKAQTGSQGEFLLDAGCG